MAKADILWTIVEQGWCKIVLTWGKYNRVLLPGLHWIGIPVVNSLYKRKMTFLKSVTDKDGNPQAEPHEDKDISSFKTTDYAYAFPFKDEEDSHALPLSGILAAIAVLENYHKAFFTASDWYSIMNSEIMPCFREILVQMSYDEDIVGKPKQGVKNLDELLWAALDSEPIGGLSILKKLRELYGIWIKSIQLRSVDPPADWRATTLEPYKAEREQKAALHKAKTSAILFDDTNQALKIWLKEQKKAGYNPTQTQIEAKQDELRQRALAKTPGYQQIHVKGLENASTAVVGGGGNAGLFVGGDKPRKNPGGGQQNPQGGGNPSMGESDDALLRQNPASLSPEDYAKYVAALKRKKEEERKMTKK